MSSVAALTTPDQNTKPGFTIYSESLVSKNSTVSGVINATDIESKTNLTVNAATNLLLGPTTSNITVGGTTTATAVVGGFTVNGSRPACWNASLYQDPGIISGSTDEFTLFGSMAGSLTVDPRVTNGFTLKTSIIGELGLGAATTMTIRAYVNGNVYFTQVIPNTGAVVGQGVTHDMTLNFQAAGGFNVGSFGGRIIREADDAVVNVASVLNVWDPTIQNTIDITGQFSDAGGSWKTTIADMFSSQCT